MNVLLTQYHTVKEQDPKLRFVDVANKIGVSEAELLAAHIGETDVVQLDNSQIADILKSFKKLNHVMALTRNKSVVNELKGAYEKLYVSEHGNSKMAMAINPKGIDLRIFLDKWRFAFAQKTDKLNSVQFFDHHGRAVHKVYTTPKSDLNAFDDIVARFTLAEQSSSIEVQPYQAPENVELADDEIEVADFQQAWADLQDVHHFPGMLKKFNVSRTQALRLAGSQWVTPVSSQCLPAILENARDHKVELMAFVGNDGMIQIFSGQVNKLKQMGEWYNVLDSDFNLHAKLDEFDSAYIVRKPTDKGTVVVSSVEFFNKQGETILTLFGYRQEGNASAADWDNLLTKIS